MFRLALLALVFLPRAAFAGDSCRVVDVAFTPSDALQIVGWVERADGTYVDTIYITQKTGRYGLGNRPGRFDFNSGPVPTGAVDDMWPYGRRVTVFPVWSHRHGKTFPKILFQNDDENNLSHPFSQSSPEPPPFCRPLMPGDDGWDTGTCASSAFTDKGTFVAGGETSLYPPRSDVSRNPMTDSPAVEMYKMLNVFDGVSQATPAGGVCTTMTWPIPDALPDGDYVVWLEVGKAFDFNPTYNAQTLPPPCGGGANPCTMPIIPWADYGLPYRGQPSIVYRVPFHIGATSSLASTQTYAGYGDPNGNDGTLRPPDNTITTDTPGSGASRLQMIAGSTDLVRVDARREVDEVAPGAPTSFVANQVGGTKATLRFIAPGDNGSVGSVSGYEIRMSANTEMTADNFAQWPTVTALVRPGMITTNCGSTGGFPPAGTPEEFDLTGLLPETDYWVGVRALDKCHNPSDISIVHFTTLDRQAGEVSACFVATAAYGSAMANDVMPLRTFRDRILHGTALGELAVVTYYTFGPAVAGVVGESELLRAFARDVLAPLVRWTRSLAF